MNLVFLKVFIFSAYFNINLINIFIIHNIYFYFIFIFIIDIVSNEIYITICEHTEKQLENINESDQEFRSILINLKLTNKLFYKIIPVITRLSNNCHQSYLLTNTIIQMLKYVDKCNKVCIYLYQIIYKL